MSLAKARKKIEQQYSIIPEKTQVAKSILINK